MNEENFTYLKPKTAEELQKAKEQKDYILDVFQDMLNTGWGEKDNIQHMHDVQMAFTEYNKDLIKANFEMNIPHLTTAHEILDNVMDGRPRYMNEERLKLTHMQPKTEEEMEETFMNRLEELYDMDSIDLIGAIYADVRDNVVRGSDPPITWKRIASQLLDNVDRESRKEAISLIYNEYIFG